MSSDTVQITLTRERAHDLLVTLQGDLYEHVTLRPWHAQNEETIGFYQDVISAIAAQLRDQTGPKTA